MSKDIRFTVPSLYPDTTSEYASTKDLSLIGSDKVGLGHNIITQEGTSLTVRSAKGIIRRARNLTIPCLLEAIKDKTRIIDLKQVNKQTVKNIQFHKPKMHARMLCILK